MNFKRYVESSDTWLDSHYIMGTDTDTITTLPADLYADGNNATVGLKGNMSQSGTPTSTTPIQPQECGERTGNLFDKNWLVEGYTLDFNTGLPTSYEERIATTSPVDVSDVTQITVSYTVSRWPRNILFIYSIFKNGVFVERMAGNSSGDTINIGDADELYLCFYDSQLTPESKITSDNLTNLMVNNGSTALPYEPYGIKIPILNNSQTTNVYLGEVQSTRRIKKLMLTGEESWRYSTSSQVHWTENVPNDYDNTLISRITTVCTHYKCIQNNTGFSGMVNGNLRLYAKETSPIAHELYIKDETYTSAADFKSYLQQQYANGTPVTIWYVLATPQTAVVNEPLRKIGDYADTVSGITIPTIAGTNTLSVDTILQPSEVNVTYHGWHPVQSVHERENGAWT